MRSLAPAMLGLLVALAPTPSWADARTDARRYFNRGMEAIEDGRTREGIELLLQANAIRPHPHVLFNIARAYASINELPLAVEYFEKYLASGPADRGDTESALAELKERLRLRQLVDQGMSAVAAGRYLEGVGLLRKAYEERPHPNLLFNIGRAYESAGEAALAVEAYKGYLASSPPDAQAVGERVRALEERPKKGPAPSRDPGGVPPDEAGMRRLAGEIAALLRGGAAPAPAAVKGSTRAIDDGEVRLAAKAADAYAETVVTASRREQSPLDAPNAVTIITADEIRLSGARNIPDLLRRVPGMDVMTMTASDWNVSMRGFNRRIANKILVLVDGRSVYLDFLGATLWSTLEFDLADIERIEVVRGPGSAIYGAYAYTGIVNILLKKPEAIGGSALRVEGGNANNLKGVYQYGGKSGAVGFRTTLAYEQADRYEREFGDRVDYTTLNTDVNASFRKARADGTVELHLDDSSRLYAGGGIAFGPQEFYGVSVLRDQHVEGAVGNARLGYSGELFSVLAFWQGTRVSSSPEYFRTGLPSLGSTVVADLFSVEPVFRPSFTLLGEHSLVIGAEYRHKSLSWDYIAEDVAEDHFGLFLQDQWAITPYLTALASARLDKHPLIGFLASPRLALIVKPTPRTAIRASFGTAYRQPTLAETYLSLAASSPVAGVAVRLVGGGAALRPERILTVDVGALAQLESAELELVGYVNRVDNLIIRSALVPTPPSTGFDPSIGAFLGAESFFENDATVYYAFGGEAAARVYPIDGLDVGASYALQLIVDLDTGKRFTDSPVHKLTLWSQYRSSFGLDLGASVHLVSDQDWVEPSFDTTDPSGFDTTPLPVPAAVMVMARVGYRLMDDRLELAVSGVNLADTGENRHLEHPFANRLEARVVGSVTARF